MSTLPAPALPEGLHLSRPLLRRAAGCLCREQKEEEENEVAGAADPHPVAAPAAGTAISGPEELLIKKIVPHPDQTLRPAPLRNGNSSHFQKEKPRCCHHWPCGCRKSVS